jgi:hypothetical protein
MWEIKEIRLFKTHLKETGCTLASSNSEVLLRENGTSVAAKDLSRNIPFHGVN